LFIEMSICLLRDNNTETRCTFRSRGLFMLLRLATKAGTYMRVEAALCVYRYLSWYFYTFSRSCCLREADSLKTKISSAVLLHYHATNWPRTCSRASRNKCQRLTCLDLGHAERQGISPSYHQLLAAWKHVTSLRPFMRS